MPTAAELRARVDSFDWDKWNKKLYDSIYAGYTDIAEEQGEAEAEKYGWTFDVDDPFTQRWFTEYVTERVTQVDETTRSMLKDVIQSTLEAETDAESTVALGAKLVEAVKDSYALSPARGQSIARNELAIAYNHGALLSYEQNGVSAVEVTDGDSDDECDEANGSIWTIDYAMANPQAHPNCVRSFGPADSDATPEE